MLKLLRAMEKEITPQNAPLFISDEQERVQKRTFTNWINSHLSHVSSVVSLPRVASSTSGNPLTFGALEKLTQIQDTYFRICSMQVVEWCTIYTRISEMAEVCWRFWKSFRETIW